jgi:hypothetical protein
MSLSSIGGVVNSVAHAVSHAAESADSVAPQTPHPETTANPHSPSTASNSMARFVPTGGFHPIAGGGQAAATAKDIGLGGIVHVVFDHSSSLLDRLAKALEGVKGEPDEDDGDDVSGTSQGAGQTIGGHGNVAG